MIQEISNIFAKTKILGTLGPASSSTETIMELIEAGLDGVRLNFSHGDYKFYDNLFFSINEACVHASSPLAVLLDLQGPKIRVGELAEPSFEIRNGETIEITVKDIKGTKERISTSYKPLPQDAKIGDIILIDDGLLRLRIISKTEDSVVCEIENGGILKPKKGMNLPGMTLSTPSVTEKDLRDLEYGLKHRLDYIALSFVRSAKDILELRQWMNERGYNKPIIAKIEKKEAIDDFDNILAAADGIMVARGDLGVELNPQDVPVIQKTIIRKCNCVGKLVITATQMLESMVNNPIPTRAEASDVANAVWDGTDAVMLSAETSVGKFPISTVETMNNIIRMAEGARHFAKKVEFTVPDSEEENTFDAFSRAVCDISEQTKCSAIIVLTHMGRAARWISKYKPSARIIAVSDSFDTMNSLCLKWGITSLYHREIKRDLALIDELRLMIAESGHAKKGELVIFTAGAPFSDQGRLNWLKFVHI
ncbi:MAG: pyruvate kinase [Ignavibacteria bacterium]|nr:pyruvate kinase [Ignavibacteria bacterium]